MKMTKIKLKFLRMSLRITAIVCVVFMLFATFAFSVSAYGSNDVNNWQTPQYSLDSDMQPNNLQFTNLEFSAGLDVYTNGIEWLNIPYFNDIPSIAHPVGNYSVIDGRTNRAEIIGPYLNFLDYQFLCGRLTRNLTDRYSGDQWQFFEDVQRIKFDCETFDDSVAVIRVCGEASSVKLSSLGDWQKYWFTFYKGSQDEVPVINFSCSYKIKLNNGIVGSAGFSEAVDVNNIYNATSLYVFSLVDQTTTFSEDDLPGVTSEAFVNAIIYDFEFEATFQADTMNDTGLAIRTPVEPFGLDYIYDAMYEGDIIIEEVVNKEIVSLENFDLVGWLVGVGNSIMEFQIVPGIVLGNVLWFIIGIGVLFLVIKIFAGG